MATRPDVNMREALPDVIEAVITVVGVYDLFLEWAQGEGVNGYPRVDDPDYDEDRMDWYYDIVDAVHELHHEVKKGMT